MCWGQRFTVNFVGGVYAVMLFTPLHIVDIDCIYVVSYWPSRDVKVILFQTCSIFHNRSIPVVIKPFFSNLKFS